MDRIRTWILQKPAAWRVGYIVFVVSLPLFLAAANLHQAFMGRWIGDALVAITGLGLLSGIGLMARYWR